MLNIYSAQRDPKIFNEPDAFIPERWFDANLDTNNWLPFGSGNKLW